jgi:hypothetical protein
MSKSAKRVQEAFQETKDAIASQQQPSRENYTLNVGKEGQYFYSLSNNNALLHIHTSDSHLQTLQVLSAYIKLLLDAPEHLWRLIEREKYFHATWLFMLARVVHRALSHDDEQDEDSWLNQGVNTVVNFTLNVFLTSDVSYLGAISTHPATVGGHISFSLTDCP